MNQYTNISLYDVKAYVRKAQNAVLNFTEMEAKVREATNNEPWGTPTSVMQQIADATNNYQQFHEIMPFVFRRFTEKSASEWRQIYKALTLLDYLVLNGSERVVDYARSHISVVEMLRHFCYIDSKGTDQGASIRKRSEELVALLRNVDKLRAERKKAKQLLAKTGAGASAVSSSSSIGGAIGGASRYAGASFNSPSLSRSDFGGSGRRYGGFSSDQYRSMQFQPPRDEPTPTQAASATDFEEYTVEGVETQQEAEDDDDFAEFQSAPTTSAPASAPSTSASTTANLLDLFDAPAPSSASQQPQQQPQKAQNPQPQQQPAAAAPQPPKQSIDLFDSLWETSKSTPFQTTEKTQTQRQQPAAQPQPSQPQKQQPQQTEVDDLLSF